MGLLDNSEPYNSDITTNNVKSSFRSIRGKFTPGPDNILPRMLIEAEEKPNSFNFVGKTAIIPLYGIRITKFIFPNLAKEAIIFANPTGPSALQV